jgi:hypothetical protein
MSQGHGQARGADPEIRPAVDTALDGAPAAPRLRAGLDQLAQALRAEHPADWETRLRKLWALALRAGEIWSPENRLDGLERMVAAVRGPGQSVTAMSPVERLEALAAAQRVRPLDDPASLVFQDWPEDESADDFVTAVHEWRRETPPVP